MIHKFKVCFLKQAVFFTIVTLKIIVTTIRAFKNTIGIDYKSVYNILLCTFKVVIQEGIRTDVPCFVPLIVQEAVTPSMDPVYMDVLTQTHSQLTVSVNRFIKIFLFYCEGMEI